MDAHFFLSPSGGIFPQQSVNEIFIRILLFLKSLTCLKMYYYHLEWHCKNILAKESNYFSQY